MKPIALILLPSAGILAGWFLRPVLQPGTNPGGVAAPVEVAGGESEAGGKKPGAPVKIAVAAPAMVKSDALPPLVLTDPKASIKSLLSFSRRSNNPLRTQARLLAFADS